LGRRFQTFQAGRRAAAGTSQPEVLHDRRKREPEIGDSLADFRAVGFGEKLRLGVPSGAQGEFRSWIADARNMSKSIAPRERLHPVEAESELQRMALGAQHRAA